MKHEDQVLPAPPPAPARGRRRVPTWVWFVAFAVFWIVLTQWLLPTRGGGGFF